MNKRRLVGALGALIVLPALTAEAQERIVPERYRRVYDDFHYAPAVRVGNTLYLSGVVAGGETFEQQFDRAFQSLRGVLEAAGSGLEHIVDLTTFHVNMHDHIDTFMEVKDRYLTDPYPAWTAIGVAALYSPRAVVEIKVVAIIPED